MEQIIQIITLLVLPLLTTEVIKKVLNKAVLAVTGYTASLGRTPKLILGIVMSVLTLITVAAGLIPGMDPGMVSRWSGILFTLSSKAIYDAVHELFKK